MIDALDALSLSDVLLAVVFIVGSARVTRLIVADTFPPSAHLRAWYEGKASGGWETLLMCPFCFSFWVVLANAATGWAAHALGPGWFMAWFIGNFIFAASYFAAIFVHFDEGTD